jgi:hypothetical protein
MELTVSVAMCECFMESPAQCEWEWDVWPSPKRIFSKIRNSELAARISKEMAVQNVMST